MKTINYKTIKFLFLLKLKSLVCIMIFLSPVQAQQNYGTYSNSGYGSTYTPYSNQQTEQRRIQALQEAEQRRLKAIQEAEQRRLKEVEQNLIQNYSPKTTNDTIIPYTLEETRKEFNKLLSGTWKNSDGSISTFKNLTSSIGSKHKLNQRETTSELMDRKDFKYIGNNMFECAHIIIGGSIVEWIKEKITVYDDYIICDFLETTKKFGYNNIRPSSIKLFLVERNIVYPPELIVELNSSSNVIHSNTKHNLNYSIQNIGKGSASTIKIAIVPDKVVDGLVINQPSFKNNYIDEIKPNEIINGSFVIETNEKLIDETITFTVTVNTGDDYSVNKAIVLSTKSPIVRGLPPDLFAELNFKDGNNNGILEALESSNLSIKITNKGKGNAQDLKITAEDNLNDNDLTIGGYSLGSLEPGKSINISIPIKAGLNIKTAEHRLKLRVTEHFGYDMDDAFLILNTFAYQAPKLIFSGLEIADSGDDTYAIKEDGLIQAGEQVRVKVMVQNIGQGDAKNVNSLITSNNQDIFVDKNKSDLENIKSGEVKEFVFLLSPNKRVTTADKLPVFLTLSETVGKGDLTNFQLPITLNARPPQAEILKVNSDFESLKKNIAKFEYNSNKFAMNTSNLIDIRTIEPSKVKHKNSVAVIFGIEKYKELPPAPFASNDADLIKEYFQKRLGIDRVVILKDNEVSGFIFDDVFNPDNGELQKEIVKGQTDLFVYYSGHGIPNKAGDNIYLFPSDGKIDRLETQGYAINKLYENLDKLGAKSVTVFLDACFSGGSRTSETLDAKNLVAMKGIKIKPKLASYTTNPNFTIFNSSSGEETSLGFDASETGLYTYFLCAGLKGLADMNNDRKITSGELKRYLFDNVTETSKKIRGLQTPEFFGNENTVLMEY